ncbi:MAG: right-handed parallel beta-helix repeat-containing protein [Acidobacteriota bacterium]|jgi:CSLREA domain-containing protein|nr:right-handed parallel beta-helix repeat-containing protein [Acidobacteriota bacterium]
MKQLRPTVLAALCLFVALVDPPLGHAAVFPVTPGATADEPDAIPGDGVCLTASLTCTLRAAVQEANAFGGSDRIEVPAGVYVLSLAGDNEDFAATGDLDITENADLIGVGPGQKIIDGNHLDRVFDIQPGVSAMLDGITVRGGSADDATFPSYLGGGLMVRGTANLDLSNCEVSANTANAGGGLFAASGSTATISDCSFRDNTATDLGFITTDGSAVLSEGNTDLDRCEVSGNRATVAAGAVFGRDGIALGVTNTTISANQDVGLGIDNTDLDVNNATFFANTSFGLSVFSAGGNSLTVRNSILASSGASDCSIVGIAVANLDFPGEHNLDSDGTCPDDGGTVDLPATDPQLGALLPAGGTTKAHVPLVGSPVIDAGNDARCEPDDQRGAQRPLDGDGSGAPAEACDIGAIEVLPCVDNADEIVSGEIITTPTEFEACFTITTGPAVDVLSGGILTLRARNAVILGNGFSVAGGELRVLLDPASGSGLTLP